MRVALCSQAYPPETAHGGISSQTELKAHGLARLGHEVHVFAQSADGRRREHADGAVRLTRVAGGEYVESEAGRWLAYSVDLARELREHVFEVVDFPEWGCEGFAYLLERAEWNRPTTVVQLHGPLAMLAQTIGWPEPASDFYVAGRAMEAACLWLADCVYSSSSTSRDWVVREYGLDGGRIPVVHMGVDTEAFRPQPELRDGRPVVVCTGRVARSKGVDVLLEAAALVAREVPDLRLRLLGRVDDELRPLVHASDFVETAAFVSRDALPEALAAGHVFAAPSVYEGGPGLALLEAMACGLPVIACEGGGVSETVRPGTGILVPPGEVEPLAEALLGLLRDRAAAEELGARARQHVLETADTRDCIRRLESLYESLLLHA
jgi:glycosyltransferase involved in cell wall biosynthesis